MKVTVSADVAAPIEKVWDAWIDPKHIVNWNFASDDWECTYATNDFRVGGKFKSTMGAKDGMIKFDFEGTYTYIEPLQLIKYKLGDQREVEIHFEEDLDSVKIIETFDAENDNPIDMQREGWQSILNNFKKYVESL